MFAVYAIPICMYIGTGALRTCRYDEITVVLCPIFFSGVVSQIRHLIMDYNQIAGALVEDAMVEMLETNYNLITLSCSLCGFSPTYCKCVT